MQQLMSERNHFIFNLIVVRRNVISEETLKNCLGSVKLEQTKRVLSMYNQTTLKPLGRCTLELHNHKTGKSYCTEFVVLKEQSTPLLGSETIQQMDLIQV